MRPLTEEERCLLNRRKTEFDAFFNQMMPVLTDFMRCLGLDNPAEVVKDAARFLGPVDTFMKNQIITDEDYLWIKTRLGYFVGELLVQKFAGYWFLNEIPDSRYFLRYVVGGFANASNPNAQVDPFFVTDEFMKEPLGRSLINQVQSVINELTG